MLAVRYVTLAALVVWLGGLVTLSLLTSPSVAELQHFHLVGYACGAVVFVCLFIIKFVGPPPRDFFPRLGLVFLMLAVALFGGFRPEASAISMTVDIVLGFVLLFWYVRE